MSRQIQLKINGELRSVAVEPGQTLIEVLRDDLRLTGTKEGCGQGECGACTVILDGQPVTSCLVPVFAADGSTVETIEGLAPEGELHPLQRALVEEGAVQCGFCTPGLTMAGVALLRETPRPDASEIREALAGNICRCTGYARVVKAVAKASEGGQR